MSTQTARNTQGVQKGGAQPPLAGKEVDGVRGRRDGPEAERQQRVERTHAARARTRRRGRASARRGRTRPTTAITTTAAAAAAAVAVASVASAAARISAA